MKWHDALKVFLVLMVYDVLWVGLVRSVDSRNYLMAVLLNVIITIAGGYLVLSYEKFGKIALIPAALGTAAGTLLGFLIRT